MKFLGGALAPLAAQDESRLSERVLSDMSTSKYGHTPITQWALMKSYLRLAQSTEAEVNFLYCFLFLQG